MGGNAARLLERGESPAAPVAGGGLVQRSSCDRRVRLTTATSRRRRASRRALRVKEVRPVGQRLYEDIEVKVYDAGAKVADDENGGRHQGQRWIMDWRLARIDYNRSKRRSTIMKAFQTQGIEGRRGACRRRQPAAGGVRASRPGEGRHEHAADRLARRRRPGGAARAAHVGRGREQEGRAAQPPGRADRLRRPDQPGQRARHLHQAARRRQGRPADRALRHGADRADHAAGQAARPAADGQLLVPGEREGAARHVVQQRAVERRLELVRRLLPRRAESRRQDRRGARRRQRLRAEPGERRARRWPRRPASSRSTTRTTRRPPPTSPR